MHLWLQDMLRVEIINKNIDKELATMTHPKARKFEIDYPGKFHERSDLERGSSLLSRESTRNPHSVLGPITTEGSAD